MCAKQCRLCERLRVPFDVVSSNGSRKSRLGPKRTRPRKGRDLPGRISSRGRKVEGCFRSGNFLHYVYSGLNSFFHHIITEELEISLFVLNTEQVLCNVYSLFYFNFLFGNGKTSLFEQGMNQLRQSAVKPRIKPWMDTFVCHDIDENQVRFG